MKTKFYNSEPGGVELAAPENIGPERTRSGLMGNVPVNSPSRITPENNGKIRPRPARENAFTGASGGGNTTAVEPSLGRKLLIYNEATLITEQVYVSGGFRRQASGCPRSRGISAHHPVESMPVIAWNTQSARDRVE